MKKILAISGSAKKNGVGIKAFKLFQEKFDTDEYDFQVIHLSDYQINNCIGCTVCFKKTKCFMNDDLDTVIEMMKKADGLIFITPIYNMNISASLKNLFDRTSYLLHKPVFFDKHSYIISSTDLGGTAIVNSYLKYIMNAYCIDNVGATGVLSNMMGTNEIYTSKLSRRFDKEAVKFKRALAKGLEYKPKFGQLIRFNFWKLKGLKSQASYPGDYYYWSNSELIKSEYFYPIKINRVKKLMISIIQFRIDRMLNKKL